MSNPETDQQPTTKLGRNDRRILGRVCASNGGGYDVAGEPEAPVDRLIKARLIQRKNGNVTACCLFVHTTRGMQVWQESNQ